VLAGRVAKGCASDSFLSFQHLGFQFPVFNFRVDFEIQLN
jgi:hypothetical protein